jgi:hypothetical protein
MELQLNHQNALVVLRQALTDNNDARNAAEAVLNRWAKEPGYCKVLMDLLANPGIETNLRWLSILNLKNGVNRHWRRRVDGITDQEKAHLRPAMLSLMEEQHDPIAIQIAVLIAKVARFDYPQSWPELFSSLAHSIQSPNDVTRRRAMLSLYHVINELASRCFSVTRQQFHSVAPDLFSFVLNIWHQYRTTLCAGPTVQAVQHASLSLKVLRRLAQYGFARVDQSESLYTFFSSVMETIQQMLQAHAAVGDAAVQQAIQKLILKCFRVVIDVHTLHPLSFKNYLLPFLQLAFSQVMTTKPASATDLHQQIAVKSMIFLRNVISCSAYTATAPTAGTMPLLRKDASTLPGPHELRHIVDGFLVAASLCELCQHLVANYLRLTMSELHEWNTDPASFLHEDEIDSVDRPRHCAELLYSTMLQFHRETLGPTVVQILRQVSANPPADMDQLLVKDAVYLAVGLAAYDLYDYLSFPEWFSTTLQADLHVRPRACFGSGPVSDGIALLVCVRAAIPTSGTAALPR